MKCISQIRYDEIRGNKSLGLIMSEHLDIPKYYTSIVSGGCLNRVLYRTFQLKLQQYFIFLNCIYCYTKSF